MGTRFTTNANWLNGSIDEVIIWNRTLSAKEIQNLYNKTLSDGQHIVTVYATDTVGNMGNSTVWFNVGTIPPTVENSTSSDIMYGEDEIVTVDAYDLNGISTVILRLDSTTDYVMAFVSGNTYTVTIPAVDLPGGTHSIRYYVNDTVGNMNSSVTDSFEVIVDNTPPTINITSPQNTTYTTDSVDLDYTVNDSSGIDWVGYSLDGQENVTLIANTTLTNLLDDLHSITVYANDTLGNMGSSTVWFTVDTLPTNVSSCGTTVSTPGVYLLNTNISNYTGGGTCITIESSNVIFDGQGYTIDGDDTYPTRGIYVYNDSTSLTNVTVRSVTVTNWYEGIKYRNASNGSIADNTANSNTRGIVVEDSSNNTNITNNTANSNSNYGIWLLSSSNNNIKDNNASSNVYNGILLDASSNNNTIANNTMTSNNEGILISESCDNNTIANNTITSSTGYGIRHYSSSNNTIYNNLFNNSANFNFDGIVYNNFWNTTKILGTNIKGGPWLGGNYWAKPDGTGFSEICTDADSDGICDSNYTLNTDNMDYLPLSLNFTVDTTPPTITIHSPENTTYPTDSIDLNVTTNEPSSITYTWNAEGNITGCQNCTSYSTTYGEYANSSEQNLSIALHFNENTSTTVHDDSGNGNDGTLTGPIWTPGKFASGLDFSNDKYITIPHSDSQVFNDSFSISFWITFKEDDRGQWIISKLNGTASWVGFHVDRTSNNKLRLMVHNTTGAYSNLAYPVSNNTLYHVVLIRDKTASKLRLYLNGTSVKNTTSSITGLNVNTSKQLVIGAKYNFGNRLNATLDEVLIFNRALGDTEISKLFNKTLSEGQQHNVTVYAKDNANNLGLTTRWFSISKP